MKEFAFVGLWFHSLDSKGDIQWQGQVIKHLGGNRYKVQLYSWIMGEPTTTPAMTFEDLLGCVFYKDSETMIEAGDAFNSRQERQEEFQSILIHLSKQ